MTAPAVRGVNHITLACADVARSIAFYHDVLGCRVVARWPLGAYLVAGDTWLALVLRDPAVDYSHIALDVPAERFAAIAARVVESGAHIWKENRSEGDSLYFVDPAGHQMEIHATDLRTRLRTAAEQPWEGLEILGDGGPIPAPVAVAGNGRRFSCYAFGVDVFVFDASERVLLLKAPADDAYQVVNGGLEANETVEQAAMREVAEEAGPDVRTRLLGAFHAGTHTYFDVPLVAVSFVAEYLGGDVVPGDDMAGSHVRWATVAEIEAGLPTTIPDDPAHFGRALATYRMLRADQA